MKRDVDTGLSISDRPLRFRCYIPQDYEISTAKKLKGYEWSWAFLGSSSGCQTLPENAFCVDRILVTRGEETIPVRFTCTRLESRWIEWESEKIAGLCETDVLRVEFRVLQSNDYGLVADTVTDCILSYTDECSYQDARDIRLVFPHESLLSSEAISIDGPRPGYVSVSSSGWTVHGGVVFSWGSDGAL